MSVRKTAAKKPAARITTTKPKRAAKPRATAAKPILLDDLLAIAAKLPQDVRDRMPRDGAQNADHYLDGSPKQY